MASSETGVSTAVTRCYQRWMKARYGTTTLLLLLLPSSAASTAMRSLMNRNPREKSTPEPPPESTERTDAISVREIDTSPTPDAKRKVVGGRHATATRHTRLGK